MTTSGTQAFNLTGADLALEVLERLQIRGPAITQPIMSSLRRSANLVQGRFTARGANLWKVEPADTPTSIPLVQGVTTYDVDPATVMVLDVWLRIFQFDETTDLVPQFTTTNTSTTVQIYWPSHGLIAGNWVSVVTPVAVGGIVVSGFYQVLAPVDSDNFTITAADAATSSTTGGSVPLFTTVASDNTVTVTLTNHGYLAGQQFIVGVSTVVGGLTIFGTYTVATVPTANTFTIESALPAGTSTSGYENDGEVQLQGATGTSQPIDRWLSPVSRDDYAAYPNKQQQSPPTVYWFNRQSAAPTLTVWPVPDGGGPYQLMFYSFVQQDDFNALMSQTPDMPYRGLEALCAGIADHMAMKWAPTRRDGPTGTKAEAAETWAEFAAEDRERVPLYLQPAMQTYWEN